MRKSGLTMVSIALYVVLFFAFSAFAIAMSMNMNYKTLAEKGNVWISEQTEKLQYNLIKSAKSSDSVDNISGKVIFSNNDEYRYDSSQKCILKNDGKLISDVEGFRIMDTIELSSAPTNFTSNLDGNVDHICIEITIKKYNQTKTTQMIVTVGDDQNG